MAGLAERLTDTQRAIGKVTGGGAVIVVLIGSLQQVAYEIRELRQEMVDQRAARQEELVERRQKLDKKRAEETELLRKQVVTMTELLELRRKESGLTASPAGLHRDPGGGGG